MNPKNVQYQVIVNRNASDLEISTLKDAAVEAGISITVEKTGGTTAIGAEGAPEVILLLKCVAIGSGVLVDIGTDVWKVVKKFVTVTFN